MKKKTKATVGANAPSVKERDPKGRFAKGHKGGGGRPKGEPRDIICKDGKKRSVATLIDDLLAAYGTLGGSKFLKKWAVHSHSNLRKFIEILFKFAPQPGVVAGDTNIQVISAVPRVERIYTDQRPDELGLGRVRPDQIDTIIKKRIKELQDQLKAKDDELQKLRGFPVQDAEEIEHEPIRPGELPEHKEPGIKEMSDDELDLEIARIQKEIKNDDVKKKTL